MKEKKIGRPIRPPTEHERQYFQHYEENELQFVWVCECGAVFFEKFQECLDEYCHQQPKKIALKIWLDETNR